MESVGLLLLLFVGIQASSVTVGLSPVSGTESTSDTAYLEADEFLTSYGYYPSSGLLPAQMQSPIPRKYSDTERTGALKLLQKFYNLPQSGKLDKETTRLMQSPRCANADITSNLNTKETPTDLDVEKPEHVGQTQKDHEIQDRDKFRVSADKERGSLDKSRKKRAKTMTGQRRDGTLRRWGYKYDVIGWNISKPSKQKHLQPIDVQRKIVEKALLIWEPVLHFKFVENKKHQSAHYNMKILFHSFTNSSWNDDLHRENAWRKNKIQRPKHARKRKGSHAHAMVSDDNIILDNRDIHFNEDKIWSNHEELLSVLLHEIGHVLGLGHSNDERSVMYSYTRDVTQLSVSDIERTEKVYEPKDDGLRKALCDAKIREVDTIFEVSAPPDSAWDFAFIVISGKRLEIISKTEPKGVIMTLERYDQFFINAPPKYDLVFSDPRSHAVFFIAGKKVYEYWMDKGKLQFPRRIYTHDNFPETPKFSFCTTLRMDRYEIVLYGKDQFWNFEYRDRKIANYSWVYPMSDETKQFIPTLKFGLQWADRSIYYVLKNGSCKWYYWNFAGGNIGLSSVWIDTPPWMKDMLCPAQVLSIRSSTVHSTLWRMSIPSLVLVIMLSLIKWY